jgi:hypothetical protein
MNLPPMIERELRVAARRGSTYWMRLGAAGLFLLIGAAPLLAFERVGAARTGRDIFYLSAVWAWCFCVFEGVRLTVDSLSREKREGTLGLLFLTDLKSRDVVLGKLAPAALHTLYGLLAIVPVLSLTWLAGGVTAGEVARVVLALLATLGLALATGVLTSAANAQAGSSWLAAFGALLLTAWLPGYALKTAFAGTTVGGPRSFWLALALTAGIALLWLTRAIRILPGTWQQSASAAIASPPPPPAVAGTPPASWSPPRRTQNEQSWLESNPALWLALRGKDSQRGSWVVLSVLTLLVAFSGLLLGGLFVAGLIMVVAAAFGFGLLVYVAWEACSGMADLRRSGLLEGLVTTPLGAARVLAGFRNALFVRFLLPVGLVLMLLTFVPLVMLLTQTKSGEAGLGMMMILGLNLWLAGQFLAVTDAGMLLGFNHGSAVRAFGLTLLWTLVAPVVALPLLVCMGPLLAIVLVVAPFVIGSLAEERLRLRFEELGK